MLIRDATPADYAAMLDLNQLSVAVLSPLDLAGLEAIAASAHMLRVVEVSSTIAAFLVAFRKGATYHSPNFLWFEQQYDDFLYIDRVVVAATHRGQGLGQHLYGDVMAQAQAAQLPRIALEVDIEPPNLASLKFHQQQGFVEVGQLMPYDTKVVSLQVKSLDTAP